MVIPFRNTTLLNRKAGSGAAPARSARVPLANPPGENPAHSGSACNRPCARAADPESNQTAGTPSMSPDPFDLSPL